MALALAYRAASRQLPVAGVQRKFISVNSWNAKVKAQSDPSTRPFCPYTPAKPANREKSPFWIYAWQVSNTFSIAHRVSGVALTGLVYGGAITYLMANSFASYAVAFGALPVLIKFVFKAGWIVPNAYHFFNGLRHLDWDFNKNLQVKNLYASARWAVVLTGAVSLFFLGSALFSDSPAAEQKKH